MKKFCIALIIVSLAPISPVQAGGKGLAVYEIWQNMRNTVTGDPTVFQPLYESPNYPFHPDLSYEVTSFAGMRDWADHYNVRLYGYITIPTTGTYNFYICSDDQSQLFLSTEGWPDSKKMIAEVATYCANSPPSWTEFPAQESASFSLVQGQIVYLEAIMREWEGSDNIYLGWTGPGFALDIIPGMYASTMHPKAASDPIPADGATLVPTSTQLSWSPPADVNDVATYKVFMGDEPNLPAMTQIADVGTATSANPGTLELGKTYYWRVETTHSNNGNPFTIRGNIWQFTTIPPIPVIKTQPQNAFLMPGDTAVFTVVAESETPMTFTWFKVASPDEQVGTGDTLTVPDVQADAQYYCNITNDGGTVKSNVVNLKIKRLIAYYPFEGNANDASGYGPNGTWNGAEAYATGMIGQAASLDGSTSYVVFGSVGISGNMPRTVAAWAKANVPTGQITTWTNIFGFTSATATSYYSFDLEKISYNGEGYGIHCYGWERMMKTPIDMDWHFLAATYDGTTITWYFDGLRVGAEALALSTEDNVHMGKRAHVAGGNWPGLVDDARIYNYALDPYQIAQLYVDAKPGESVCPEFAPGDINKDCKVTMADFAELARVWMECGRIPESECTQ
ncbi:MAG: hypothetical protein GX455_02360 [Phycisphaerae bacterium]|nr:hypothetical protein [Phycisphaerae bacterium]